MQDIVGRAWASCMQ